ncbi:MAG: Uma2 family endonuclease [Saprospiraceae bacterium]
MPFPVSKRLFTAAEYFRMGEVGILQETGIELINGEIVEMSPIGSKHARVVKLLNHFLSKLLADRCIISIQDPIIVNDHSAPEPDVAILKYKPDFYALEHPHAEDILLLIEVADSSLEYDRSVKRPLYAQSGIPEYWLVNLEKDEIEAFWEPAGDHYKFRELLRAGDTLQSRTIDLKLEVNQLLG